MAKRAHSRATKKGQAEVGAAEFKARCLELIERVHEARAEYVVTRHGTPVARLVPIDRAGPSSPFGVMAGTVVRFDRPLDPVAAVWSLDGPEDPSAD